MYFSGESNNTSLVVVQKKKIEERKHDPKLETSSP